MATNKPISGFPMLLAANVEPADQLIIVDVEDLSSGASTGTTKKITLGDALNNPNNGPISGILVPIRGTAAAGRIVNTANNGIVLQSPGGIATDFAFLSSGGTEIAALTGGDSSLTVIGPVRAPIFQGSSLPPTPTKSAGTATFVVAIPTASSASSNSAGTVNITVTGTGSWTIRVTYDTATPYTTIPHAVFAPTSANFAALTPYLSSESEGYFEISGSNFGATGNYSFNYQVIQ